MRVAALCGMLVSFAAVPGGAYAIDGVIDSLGMGAPSAYLPLIRPVLRVNGILLPLIGLLLVSTLVMRNSYDRLKRMFDIVGSIIVLSMFFPVLLFAAIMIKLDSPGPVLIRQTRVGVNRRNICRGRSRTNDRRRDENKGSLFTILKLRTMRADAESGTGPVWAQENDDRITRVGKILRKTHIDEIPQFVNVLRGEMCIVGPRPERPLFIRRLSCAIKNYERRLRVKPGITGLAQVRYRYAASVEDTKKKLRYDLLYVNKKGLGMDLRILAKTVNMVVSMRGSR